MTSQRKSRQKLAFIFSDFSRARVVFNVLLVAGMGISIGMGIRWAATHYSIGYDPQYERCLPWTWYLLEKKPPEVIRRGDLVGFISKGRLGPRFEQMTGGKGLVVKQVGGLPGDVIEVRNNEFFLNGKRMGHLSLLARMGKPSGHYDRVEVVRAGHYALIGTLPNSIDSRYYGQVPQSDLIMRAYPIL